MNLAELNASLNRQKGGFDRWAHSRLNAVESVRQKHEVELRKATSEYEDLKASEEKLHAEVEGLDSSINQENKEAEELLEKLSYAKKSAQMLPEEVGRIRDEVSLKEDLLKQRKSETRHGAAAKQDRLGKLQRLAETYGQRLGLHFKHSAGDQEESPAVSDNGDSGNALRIGFTQIDRRNPDKTFWFDVRIREDDTYTIQQVVPQVEGLQELEQELNADNDFSKFVRKMRKKFKESV
mmetsp:Transcript_18293/g.37896  ORF Transcript_18293/g.37896 Transcript_18293/m.37896 type:complete len:237 (-) Transcript_18293:51-761(-)